MSRLFDDAIEAWRECHAAFRDYQQAEYDRAAEACRGNLLNRRGRDAGVDSLSLFQGNRIRAEAYASPELLEHWRTWPRPTFQAFELQWVALRDAEGYY